MNLFRLTYDVELTELIKTEHIFSKYIGNAEQIWAMIELKLTPN